MAIEICSLGGLTGPMNTIRVLDNLIGISQRENALGFGIRLALLMAMVTPLSGQAMMDMPSYSKPMEVAEGVATDKEMGKRFGQFMEGFSQEMNAQRGREPPLPVERSYGGDRDYDNDDRRSDAGRGDRRDRYPERRDFREGGDPGYGEREGGQHPYNPQQENPYRYDPWGARYWGHQGFEYDPWNGLAPGELWDRPHPYDGGYGWNGYPPPEHGYGARPYRSQRDWYEPGSRYDRRYRSRYNEYNDRPYTMSFDNPWDSFWPRSWPFGNRDWEW